MSSGSIQLAAQGMQDVYLNGTPDVSYFSGVFRRHSTFLLQTAEYPFDTPVQFGGLGKVKIPYRGDLLFGTTLKVVLPPLYTPGPGWVYPLATNSNYVPWIKDQSILAKIRTNLPTFKTYFSDGSNTITYINRSVAYYNTYSPYSSLPSQTVPQLIRLICIQSTNNNSIQVGNTVTGLPYTGNVTVAESFTAQEFSSNGVSFNYNTVDVICVTVQVIQPILILTSVTFWDGPTNVASAKIVSPSCIPWIRNDFMYVTYNPAISGFIWKTIFPLVKPISNVFMNINVSNLAAISTGMNITGLSNNLNGTVTVESTPQVQFVTPVKLGSPEYFSLPGLISVQILYTDTLIATSNISYIQYPSDIDYSVFNANFTDYRFRPGNRLVYTSNNEQFGTIVGVTSDLSNRILTIFENSLPPPAPESPITVSIFNNLNIIAVANVSVNNSSYITSTNFGPSAVISNVTLLSGLNISGLPVKTRDVRTLSNSVSSNVITASFVPQPVVPITTPVDVTFSNLTTTVSGTVSYTYFTNPVTISKIAFPSQQSCVFWGFDPGAVTFTGSR